MILCLVMMLAVVFSSVFIGMVHLLVVMMMSCLCKGVYEVSVLVVLRYVAWCDCRLCVAWMCYVCSDS